MFFQTDNLGSLGFIAADWYLEPLFHFFFKKKKKNSSNKTRNKKIKNWFQNKRATPGGDGQQIMPCLLPFKFLEYGIRQRDIYIYTNRRLTPCLTEISGQALSRLDDDVRIHTHTLVRLQPLLHVTCTVPISGARQVHLVLAVIEYKGKQIFPARIFYFIDRLSLKRGNCIW